MKVGVIGSGKFGTTISKLLSANVDVLLHSRSGETLQSINERHQHLGVDLSPRIRCTLDIAEVVRDCDLIFPVVPSQHFRDMVGQIAHLLEPRHIVIQCTKGLDVGAVDLEAVRRGEHQLHPSEVHTMSDIILQETSALRVGCLSGPNLSAEILAGEPCATVIASPFEEVCDIGRTVLQSERFRIYDSRDLKGVEWSGALKNAYAIGSGMIFGMGFNYNLRAVLITRAMSEMARLAEKMGGSRAALTGMAGIGDMVATASINKSRNFSVGERFGKGEDLKDIMSNMNEAVEGLRTIIVAKGLSEHFGIDLPIIQTLFRTVYEGQNRQEALTQLMQSPYQRDGFL